MSVRLLSKLDIDVLVQLAWLGPADCESWRPLTDDPQALGTMLWSRNYERAGHQAEEPRPVYEFTPLPITVTAIEGVKQCEYYVYQTATDGKRWQRDGLGKLLGAFRAQLLHTAPEHEAAPWGWTGSDLRQRADRPAPVLPETVEPAPSVVTLFKRWADAGLPLIDTGASDEERAAADDPRSILGGGYHRPAGHSGFAPVVVRAYADEGTAKEHFARAARKHQPQRFDNDVHVYRFGTSVATTFFLPDYEGDHIASVDERISKLGEPDDHWWSMAPPLQELTGAVLASHVRLSTTTVDPRALFARTPTEVKALSTMVADDEVKDLLASVNTRKQTAVLFQGVSEVAFVFSGSVVEEVLDHGLGPKLEHRMLLKTSGASMAVGTLMVVDRLSRTPAAATLRDPALYTTMLGNEPHPKP